MNEYIIRNIKNNKTYEYFNINGKKIKNKIILNKISKIYIPPAYQNVKIYLNSDILATGINSAGRKQYIYSDHMKKKREVKKYNQLCKLSKNIDKLKKKINKDLLNKEFTKNKLIALVLKIMDLCNFRTGNKKYEEKYGSFGLTTLHKRHVLISKNKVEIDFIGKKGVKNNCIIKNKMVQDIIKKVYHLSNRDNSYIFSIIYKEKDIQVNIQDINKYLEYFNITCKDLRTWNANIIFLKNFKKELENVELTKYEDLKIRKKMIRTAIQNTAKSLHHTSTICKSSYIFKKIIEEIENNSTIYNRIKDNNSEDLLDYFLLRIIK